MKGKIISVVISALILIWSQDAFAQSVSLGLRGGLNFASLSISGVEPKPDVSFRTAFGFGGVAEIGISEPIYLQVEPRYVQKGANFKFTFFGGTIKGTLKFAYFEIPVSVKAKFNAYGVQPYIFAGPTVSFLSSAKSEVNGRTDDIKDDTESMEYSLDFGAGVAYEFAPKTFITGDVRYTLGLSRINKHTDPNDRSTLKSRDIKILIGLLFSL